MLVLVRRVGETLKIGDDIELTVLSVMGRQVRVGITAPRDVTVLRGELTEKRETKVPAGGV